MPPKMLVGTRFGLGIKDPMWFEHRFALSSAITAPSLLAQEDQHFEWALFVDPECSDVVRDRLSEVLAPFEGRAYVCADGRGPATLGALVEARGLADPDGYVLTGRIDDDDAWDRHTVGEVRARVESWRTGEDEAPGYGLSFEDGLVWLMYDMVDLDQLDRKGTRILRKAGVRPFQYPFTSISGYAYAKGPEALAALTTGHAQVSHFMVDHGYSVHVASHGEPMWLYCRHKQTDSPIHRGSDSELNMTIPDLESKFGIDGPQTKRYIVDSAKYGYGRVMRKFVERRRLLLELREVEETLHGEIEDATEVIQLKDREATLRAELAELSENVTSSPGDIV